MISNRNDIFRCLIIGSCLFIFWGVIIIWIVSYQNLCHALYLTLYFSMYSGVTIFWNSRRSMPWDVPINWNMSSNWHQRVRRTVKAAKLAQRSPRKTQPKVLLVNCNLCNCVYILRSKESVTWPEALAFLVKNVWNLNVTHFIKVSLECGKQCQAII